MPSLSYLCRACPDVTAKLVWTMLPRLPKQIHSRARGQQPTQYRCSPPFHPTSKNFCLRQLSQTNALFCRLPHLPSPLGYPTTACPNRPTNAVPHNCTTSPKGSPSQPKRHRPRSPKGMTTPPPAAKRPARSGAVLDTPRAADLSCVEGRGQCLINR